MCKRALVSDRDGGDGDTETYRSLWYCTESRVNELEDVLAKHINEDAVRPYIPYHMKFRYENRPLVRVIG